MSQEVAERPAQEFVVSDALWERVEPLLPEREQKAHPLGCHRQRIPDRLVLNSIFYVLRTGCQWKALDVLDATRFAKSSTSHSRFVEWLEAEFFVRLWQESLHEYDDLVGLDWEWLALDGAMTKAPLGGEKKRAQPHRPRQKRRQEKPAD